MQHLVAITLLLIMCTPVANSATAESSSSCLPKDVQLKSLVQEPPTDAQAKPLTVEQKLIAVKAKCKNGKLVDRAGKEIRFVHLIGCWGNPPEDYQEQLDRQQKELKRLREKYTVIEISCTQGDAKEIH
jgi:hypothetical protein